MSFMNSPLRAGSTLKIADKSHFDAKANIYYIFIYHTHVTLMLLLKPAYWGLFKYYVIIGGEKGGKPKYNVHFLKK